MAIFDTIISPLLTSVQGLISEFHLSPEDAAKANQALADTQSRAISDSHQYELGLATIAAQDKISARNMNTATRDSTAKILAIGVSFGFFGLISFMAFREVPATSKDLLNILLGALSASFISIISFYFGSSSGSQSKDDVIASNSEKK
jgi:hypothetical protein